MIFEILMFLKKSAVIYTYFQTLKVSWAIYYCQKHQDLKNHESQGVWKCI